jgi:hypothetical protein
MLTANSKPAIKPTPSQINAFESTQKPIPLKAAPTSGPARAEQVQYFSMIRASFESAPIASPASVATSKGGGVEDVVI